MRNNKKADPVPIENHDKNAAKLGPDEIRPNEMWRRYVEEPVIRFRELLSITRVGRSKAYTLMNPQSPGFDPDYPTGFPLFDSPRSPKAFYRHEAIAWIEGRANKKRQFQKGNVA